MRLVMLVGLLSYLLSGVGQLPAQTVSLKELATGPFFSLQMDEVGGACWLDTASNTVRRLSPNGVVNTVLTEAEIREASGNPQLRMPFAGMPNTYTTTKSVACSKTETVVLGHNPAARFNVVIRKPQGGKARTTFNYGQPLEGSEGLAVYNTQTLAFHNEVFLTMSNLGPKTLGFGVTTFWLTQMEVRSDTSAKPFVGFSRGGLNSFTESTPTSNFHWLLTQAVEGGPWNFVSTNRITGTTNTLRSNLSFIRSPGTLAAIGNESYGIFVFKEAAKTVYMQVFDDGRPFRFFSGLPENPYSRGLTRSGMHYILTVDGKLYRHNPATDAPAVEISLPMKVDDMFATGDRVLALVGTKLYEIAEQAKPVLTVTAAVADIQTGLAYRTQLQVTGGTPPYAWSLVSGSLPSGLTLSRDGVVSGTTFAVGTHTFTVEVSDNAGNKTTQGMTVKVSENALAPEITAVRLAAAGTQSPSILGVGTFGSLFGKNLFPTKITTKSPFPKSVRASAGGEDWQVLVDDIPAPLFYMSDEQINFMLPQGAKENAKIQVVRVRLSGEVRSKPFVVSVHPTGGAFTYDGLPLRFPGSNPQPIAITSNSDGSYPKTADDRTTTEFATSWFTGTYRLSEEIPIGEPAPADRLVTVTDEYELWMLDVDGAWRQMQPLFFGLTPGSTGLYQLNFKFSDIFGDPVRIRYGETILRIKDGGQIKFEVKFYVRGNVE